METLELMAERDFDSNDDARVFVGWRWIDRLQRKLSSPPLPRFVVIAVVGELDQLVNYNRAGWAPSLPNFQIVLMTV